MFRQRVSISLFLLILGMLAALPFAIAEEAPPAEATDSGGEAVTIKPPAQETISEFRINGQLYMIRITPTKGAPYYLVDSDGDGNLETRWNNLAPNILIPSWVLIRW